LSKKTIYHNSRNEKENSKSKEYVYKLGDKVLLSKGTEDMYETHHQGPFAILQVYDDSTVGLKAKSVADTNNIRTNMPYRSNTDPDHGRVCNMRTFKRKRTK
jgi:hypothetical protein